MAMQTQKHKATVQQQQEAEATTEADIEAKARTETQQDLLDSDLLDEIDSVLETNAQEFVAAYIQQGGE